MAGTATQSRKEKVESATAESNGERIVSGEDLTGLVAAMERTNNAVLSAFRDETSANRETMTGIIELLEQRATEPSAEQLREQIKDELRNGERKEAVKEEIREVRDGLVAKASGLIRDTVDLIIPRDKDDFVHVAEGTVIGFVGGRLLPPLPVAGI